MPARTSRQRLQQSLYPDALVRLYDLDLTPKGGPVLRWTPGPYGTQSPNLIKNPCTPGPSDPHLVLPSSNTTLQEATGNDLLAGYGSSKLSYTGTLSGPYDLEGGDAELAFGDPLYPITPGYYASWQAIVQPRKCSVILAIQFYKADGITKTGPLAQSSSVGSNDDGNGLAVAVSQYNQLWVQSQAPSDAAFLRVRLIMLPPPSGSGVNPSVVFSQMMLHTGIWPLPGPLAFQGYQPSGRVKFGGVEYTPMPIIVEGLAKSGAGQLPRPRVTVPNYQGLLSLLMASYDNLLNVKVTRRSVFARHLDDGHDPDPEQFIGPDVYYIDRVVSRGSTEVVFELVSALDLQGRMLPRRQVIKSVCGHTYRYWNGTSFVYGTCPYNGSNYYTADGVATTNPAADKCDYRLKGCVLRYGEDPLPMAAFPGVQETNFR